jgi:hypothetical protein
MHAATDEDDELDVPCYRHPARTTALRCIECDRAICIDCAVAAPVGFKCPDHARTSRAARGVIPVAGLVRGVGAGIVVAVVLGVILSVVQIPFLGIILAYFAGTAVGEVTRRASGGYRDPVLARVAAIAAAIGMLLLPIGWLLGGASPGAWLAWTLVSAGVAAYGAFTRAA